MSETKGVSLRLPVELFEQVESARGAVPRERWIRGLIERAVGFPAVRTSSEVKADVVPIPREGRP